MALRSSIEETPSAAIGTLPQTKLHNECSIANSACAGVSRQLGSHPDVDFSEI